MGSVRCGLVAVLAALCAAVPARGLEGQQATLRVAAVQCYSVFADPARNRKHAGKLVRRAAKNGAKIVVLPETAVTGYLTPDLKTTWQVDGRALSEGLVGVHPKPFAETVPGKSSEVFGKLADELDIYLTVTFLEVDRKTGKYYNTSLLFGPDGKLLIHYRKRDPWPWAERGWATPGDLGNPVVETPYGRLGLLICFDIHDQAAVMGKRNIHMLLYSIAWVDEEGSDWFAKRLPAVAKKNGLNIIGANWTVPKAPKPTWHGYGQSCIIDRTGNILAKATDDLADEIVYADIPLPPWSAKGSGRAPGRK